MLYKFLSKYVHPTSWIVNRSPEWTDAGSYRNLLVGLVQVLVRRIQYRLESEFALKHPVPVSKQRAIPWKSSSYDSVPVAELRALHRATQTELDVYTQRWNANLQNAPTASDVTALELFALSDYLTQRFDWPSWPLRGPAGE